MILCNDSMFIVNEKSEYVSGESLPVRPMMHAYQCISKTQNLQNLSHHEHPLFSFDHVAIIFIILDQRDPGIIRENFF